MKIIEVKIFLPNLVFLPAFMKTRKKRVKADPDGGSLKYLLEPPKNIMTARIMAIPGMTNEAKNPYRLGIPMEGSPLIARVVK